MARARVLVVDDEDDLVEILRTNLEAAGYEVFAAANGVEGLRRFREARPHLVILDVLMPQMDGWEVLSRIRRDRQGANTPVLMLTCLAADRAVLRGLADGAVEYVTKPFEPTTLVAGVRTLLDVFDPSMREERREWLIARQQRRLAEAAGPLVVTPPIYTRSNVEAPPPPPAGDRVA